ncbi:Zinc finger and SCAN domain-containing protein 29 [Chelonia mydas]|uniref:Zinc finger and SCAN domain-containing protein 29 n=1 Tax=Chelonia mydas TaxID=8469 RepID=M7BMB9_CHEMY|nr:Zinc finger and SCAN domain-containing protein 29 [Chelonia mydas]
MFAAPPLECCSTSVDALGFYCAVIRLQKCSTSVDALVFYCAVIGLQKYPTMSVLATLVITLNSTALPSGNTLVWSNGEVLDLISVWREEAVQPQLCSSQRTYDIYGQISRAMLERGHDRDLLPCRVKVKELWNAYRNAREANSCSGAAPATCCFYKELDAIFGGDPTSMPNTTMDTSEASATRQEEEEEEEQQQSRSEGAPAEEDTTESLDACSQELFSSQEEGSQSRRAAAAFILGRKLFGEKELDSSLTSTECPDCIPEPVEAAEGQIVVLQLLLPSDRGREL